MDIFKVIEKRRSIRKFKPEPVTTEHLRKILEAGRLAPSGGNRQPWYFIVIRDLGAKKVISNSSKLERNQKLLMEADTIIVLISNPELEKEHRSPFICSERSWYKQDPMLAGEHMVLVATALGYGTCWIAGFNDCEVKKVLKIPENLAVIALIPIGVPNECPPPRALKAFKDTFFKDSFGIPLEL
ncbi:MAG: nitroreductase family protein [Candidatus Bathyarchaeota archaeon]